MTGIRRWWGKIKCLAGWHDWEEERRWIGPAFVVCFLPINVEHASQGIDMCRRCGERQKFLINDRGGKDFAEIVHDERE